MYGNLLDFFFISLHKLVAQGAFFMNFDRIALFYKIQKRLG